MTSTAWANGAFVCAVAGFVALRFERAFAIGALVFRTREALRAFVSRAAAFAASALIAFGC